MALYHTVNGSPVEVKNILIGGAETQETVKGNNTLSLPEAKANSLSEVILDGATEQSGTPTPTTPMDIVCNNGVLKFGQYGKNLLDVNSSGIVAGYLASDGSLVQSTSWSISDYIPIKANTTFTYSTTRLSGGLGSGAYLAYYDANRAFISTQNQGSNANKTFTTPDGTAYIKVSFFSSGNWQVELGSTATPYEPYHVGIHTDGTQETVTVTGKNLFNKDDDTNWGGWYPTNGVIASSTVANRTLVMRCQPNTTYYFKHCVYTGGLRAFYVEDENYADGSHYAKSVGTTQSNANTVYSITTSANAKWLFVCFARLSGSVTATLEEQASDFILSTEVLTSGTPYIPYYNGGTATAKMLLKVGTYQDVQEVLTGSVIHRCGIKVLDGTENWNTGSSAYSNRFTLAGAFNDIAHISNANVGYSNCYTVTARSTSIQQNLQNNQCGWNTTYVFCVRDDRFDTVAQFTAWLADQYNAGTPVIVVYPLATATTETVTSQTLNVQTGNNALTATGSISTLGLSATYTKGTQLKPNYVIRNDKLVWAKPNMYLTGPVNYEVVGSPTIVDGVASGFSSSNYVQLPQAPDFSKPFEIVICFTKNTSVQGTSTSLFDCRGINGPTGLFIYMPSDTRIHILVGNNSGSWVVDGDVISGSVYPIIDIGVRYYFKLVFDGSSYTGYIKTDNTEWVTGLSISSTVTPTDLSNNPRIGVPVTWGDIMGGSIDLKETYIKVNGQLWFYGKNYATQNIAPVPSGYTYGTTTTPSIGYVDMRTQAFTAAPTGATIGRDEE